MKRSIIIIALVIVNTACSTQKHVTCNQVKTTSESEVKELSDSRLKTDEHKDITNSIDTHIVEQCDTIFTSQGSEITGSQLLSDMLSGMDLNIENADVKGSLSYDSLTGKLILKVVDKPLAIPVSFNRSTDTHQVINDQSRQTDDLVSSYRHQQNDKATTDDLQKARDVKTSMPWWAIPLYVIIPLLLFFIVNSIIKKRGL